MLLTQALRIRFGRYANHSHGNSPQQPPAKGWSGYLRLSPQVFHKDLSYNNTLKDSSSVLLAGHFLELSDILVGEIMLLAEFVLIHSLFINFIGVIAVLPRFFGLS